MYKIRAITSATIVPRCIVPKYGCLTTEPYPKKVTFGEMHERGVRDVLIYCRDYRCPHHIEINADCWADDVRLADIEPKFFCTKCGQRGGEIRPKFGQAKMGSG